MLRFVCLALGWELCHVPLVLPFLACYVFPLESQTLLVVCFCFEVQVCWIHYDNKTRVKKKIVASLLIYLLSFFFFLNELNLAYIYTPNKHTKYIEKKQTGNYVLFIFV